MLNKIILRIISQNFSQPNAMISDCFEEPSTYKGWVYPIRYLLALRYLKTKNRILNEFRLKKTYPISNPDFTDELVKHLSNKKRSTKPTSTKKSLPNPIFSLIFKANFIYPILAVVFIIGAYHANQWQQQKRLESALANYLPYFSDLLHRRLLFKHNNNDENLMQGINASIEQTEEKILSELPIKNGVRELMQAQLTKLKNSASDSEAIMLGFKDINTLFDQVQLPTELPLFHVHRIDKVPAVDGALGLTFKDRGIGSIILVDQIKSFARESILPALTFQGRNYIIPHWMQGHYEIEEAVTQGYKKDIDQIYTNKEEQRQIKNLIKDLIKDKDRMKNAKIQQTMQRTNSNNDNNIFGNGFDAISVLLGKNQKGTDKTEKTHSNEFRNMTFNENNELTQKLDNTLYPSIEYHEAYHQINKKQWIEPTWLKPVFQNKLSENAIEHTLEELGAYLAQLANTDKGQNIWLSKLLIFSLNPMTQGQAEYYASSIIFNAMAAIDAQKPIQGHYVASVDEKTKTFKMLLTKNNKEISKMARQAYQILFKREVPLLSETPLK